MNAHLSSTRTASRSADGAWAATASALRASPAAAIEQNHDERGIIWPDAIAPFTVVLCPIGMDRSSAEVKAAAEKLHADLRRGRRRRRILDDQGERPGAMFADWELIGVPHRVVISDRGLKEGQLDYRAASRDGRGHQGCRRARCSTFVKEPVAGVISRRACLLVLGGAGWR